MESSIRTQLWATDGTAEGTELVFQEPGSSFGYTRRNLTVLGNKLLFTAPNALSADGISTDDELFVLTVTE